MGIFMTYEASERYGPTDPRALGNATYEVHGYRSLQNFHISLSPGLNLLLGTNGSGKTNFVDLLDFMTVLVNQNVAAAVSSSGGVARVFSQESLKRKIPRVTVKIRGIADLTNFMMPTNIKKPLFKFEYEVDIRYSKLHTAVYIANETIKLKNLFSVEHPFDCDTTVGSIELHRFSPIDDEDPRWNVGTYLLTNSARNPLRHIHAHRIPTRKDRIQPVSDIRVQMLSTPPLISSDESILSSRTPFPALDAVRSAIARGRAFNLVPHRAKTPDDISAPPKISPNGAGLSATIYQMQQLQRADSRTSIIRRSTPKNALQTIVEWTKLVIPDLQQISAIADPHSGKYLVFLHVGNEEKSLKIPLQSASDGTLRWLVFACLIVSRGSEYTFEEPENFLHPKMQQYLIDLLRDSLPDKSAFSRYIISTHSETVINQCLPSEIILFDFVNGETVCKRLSNAEELVEQVNATGFGLGHYFAMNALR